MSQIAITHSLFTIASVLYLISGISTIRSMSKEGGKASAYVRWLTLVGFVSHGAAIFSDMFVQDMIYFGFAMALSLTLFIAVAVFLVESFWRSVSGLMGVFLVVAAAGVLAPTLFPGNGVPSQQWSLLFKTHLLLALSAYSFMLIAVVQAVLFTMVEKQLKDPTRVTSNGLLSNMPNLMAMERILYRIIACGFICLSALLVLGAFATLETHGVLFMTDHKTILTWVSWIVFAVLLIGRRFFGWRNRKALAWFWVGFSTLVVAYFLYSFIMELFL
jgi:ABC-type uncharacterized transport system permease subunit